MIITSTKNWNVREWITQLLDRLFLFHDKFSLTKLLNGIIIRSYYFFEQNFTFGGGKSPKSKNNWQLMLLSSKIGSKFFPFFWYQTLITRFFPKLLGIAGGIHIALFGRYYPFLILIFLVFLLVKLTNFIIYLFVDDKDSYSKLDDLFSKNEINCSKSSHWRSFKEMYLEDIRLASERPSKKKFKTKFKSRFRKRSLRKYSTSSKACGPIRTGIKTLVTTKLGSVAVQGAVASGSGAVYGAGAFGVFVAVGGDQVIRYCAENFVNSMSQENYQWPPLKMQTPAEVWNITIKK